MSTSALNNLIIILEKSNNVIYSLSHGNLTRLEIMSTNLDASLTFSPVVWYLCEQIENEKEQLCLKDEKEVKSGRILSKR